MARRARTARRSDTTAPVAPASPYIRRSLPVFDVLSEDQLTRLEGQVDWLLENVGIAFRDDPAALDVWRRAGVVPGGEHGDLIKADAQW
ncbi:MAG TPA: trimethylamine methyltransferase, partial [Roseovarius nubinhibens]|nr:trimethylamine methyltransferase [Roseovarius nubinhibens]